MAWLRRNHLNLSSLSPLPLFTSDSMIYTAHYSNFRLTPFPAWKIINVFPNQIFYNVKSQLRGRCNGFAESSTWNACKSNNNGNPPCKVSPLWHYHKNSVQSEAIRTCLVENFASHIISHTLPSFQTRTCITWMDTIVGVAAPESAIDKRTFPTAFFATNYL